MLDTTLSVPGICDVHRYEAPAARSGAPSVLIELPHGATRHVHYLAVRDQLAGSLPEELEEFFFVNTDVGTPECAQAIGQVLSEHGVSTLILRSLIPRTLIDCNRTVSEQPDSVPTTMTAGIPEYIRDERDRRRLTTMHAEYHSLVASAYSQICSSERPGLAIQLHSYAPKSVHVDNIDDGIVAALRLAYEPARYAGWEDRPDVDIITETQDREFLAPATLVEGVRHNLAAIGIIATENQSYRLHNETWGYLYAKRYPGRVLCIELNRALLATPFSPFSEMTIGVAESARLAGPIASACASFLHPLSVVKSSSQDGIS